MPEMESLSRLLHRTIKEGVPLFNGGQKRECYDLYLEAAKYAATHLQESPVGGLLNAAISEASELGEIQEWSEGAWVLRHCFDDILDRAEHRDARGFLLAELSFDEASSDSYWQDEQMRSSSDIEKGQAIADISYILRASITPKTHTRYTKTYDDCFPASEAVEVLTTLGLAGNRAKAVEKCNLLLKGSFIIPVSHAQEDNFKDGTHLYRFSDAEELQAAHDRLIAQDKLSEEGADDIEVLVIALENTLELPFGTESGEVEQSTFNGISAHHLSPRRLSSTSIQHHVGDKLAQLCASVENIVDIKDRKYRLKTYEKCFVGKEAVDAVVKEGLAVDRRPAVAALNQLLDVGLLHHVTRDHLFEDKFLYYRFTSVADIKQALDVTAALPKAPVGEDLLRYSALVNRYKQFAGLDITEILKSFYGCDTEEGFDLVDLQNWRNNMKRWGFGRREDQDDDMVEKLAPIVVNIDPDTWDVSGDEQWESPYGILAQIAIFDQIPRSAFRGTADAFKWDELAIRATKVALEKGYFESAFNSTLNQFLLLLPLEHSESWEDQKLGVSLLLQLLSTVAIQDEGLSDYEIVKRLEFSKRLTRAFLEHAQVIAKFKRYPHRNRPLGRTTTLEERIFLASDLVPGWARSQQPEDARNIVRLPVIPLKRLTRGS